MFPVAVLQETAIAAFCQVFGVWARPRTREDPRGGFQNMDNTLLSSFVAVVVREGGVLLAAFSF